MTRKTIIAVLCFCCVSTLTSAQSRAVGVINSLSIFGVSLSLGSGEMGSHNIMLAANMDNAALSLIDSDGFFVSYDYSYVLFSRVSRSGIVKLSLGPGIWAGYLDNAGAEYIRGAVAAAEVVLSLDYDLYRHISIGLRTSPSFGFHIQNTVEYPSMTLYKAGLVEGLVPQFTIRYRFLK